MNRIRKVNLLCFLVLVFVFVAFQYCVDLGEFSNRIKPWHMGKSDSLSESYQNTYRVIDQQRISKGIVDTNQIMVLVLVDAWGVPYEEKLMSDEFKIFDIENSKKTLHKRLTEFTQYAEQTEYRLESKKGLFLFGGDSLEYGRPSYIGELGYESHYFCQKCNDKKMVSYMDSVLNAPEIPDVIAFTTQSSRDGNLDSLHNSLKLIAEIVKKHPEVNFVIQGTHRPILCSAETRERYYQHWVPAVVVNAK